MKKIMTLFVVLVALAAFSGIAAGQGQAVDDKAIEAQINKQIQSNPALSIGNVNVQSKNGNVTLSGKVANKVSEQQIVDMVKKTPGVKSVKSNLQVYQQR